MKYNIIEEKKDYKAILDYVALIINYLKKRRVGGFERNYMGMTI